MSLVKAKTHKVKGHYAKIHGKKVWVDSHRSKNP
jgi:hypothetical protein